MTGLEGLDRPVYPATPFRPEGVPTTATYLPPADDFSALAKLDENRTYKRGQMRVAFEFAIFDIVGVRLHQATHRALNVHKKSWSMGRCLIFNTPGPVPGVWAWTLKDEREGQW